MNCRQFINSFLALRKFTFYTIFLSIHWALFAIGWWKQASDPRLAPLNTLQYSVWFSRGAGLVLTFDTALILLPMCRTILRYIRPKIRWLPLDESQWLHRQTAYQLLFWTVVHVASHYVNFFNVEKRQLRPEFALQIHYTQAGGITGHVMLLCMLLMYTTSHAQIRNQSFETFWYTHHLFIPFFLGLYTHATGCFVRDTAEPQSPLSSKYWTNCLGYSGWRWELVSGGLYLAERILREIRASRKTEIIKVIKHPFDAIEIQFRKPSMKYKSGQWLFLNCPDVSLYQWHPFTITSCPYDPYISVHVKQVGDFTNALAVALGVGPKQIRNKATQDLSMGYEVILKSRMPRLRIDGPYGAPAEDVFENEIAVLIGTGIGVTPWASILKNIWHMRRGPNPPKRLRCIEFIWICRDTTSFEWFQTLLSSLEAQMLQEDSVTPEQGGFLRIHTYLTKNLDMDTVQNIMLNSVGQDVDPLTELRSRTRFGRPNFYRLFTTMRDGLLTGTYLPNNVDSKGALAVATATGRITVGVYFCGPNVAARSISKACKKAKCPEVRFKFWKEHF